MKKTIKHICIGIFALLCITMISSLSVSAATYKNKWYTAKNGAVYYYNDKGKVTTGRKKIGNYYYYFDQKGRQRVGWQRSLGEYYFFRISKGKGAYMLTNRSVNGIRIAANGKANRTSGINGRKLATMLAANRTVESLTKLSLQYTKEQKLRKCFDYTVKKYNCSNIGSFRHTSTWGLDYAERVIIPKDKRYRADCYTYGCAMAYLANACGGKASCVSSGGHGWCEVDGYVYDSNWSMADRRHNYFKRPLSLYEPGTPNYKGNRVYIQTV